MALDSVSTSEGAATQSVGERPAKWIEPVPLEYRRRRAFIALGIGGAIGLSILGAQIYSAVPLGGYWVGAMPLGIGFMRYRYWLQLETITRYSEDSTVFSMRERTVAAAKPIGIGAALSLVFALLGIAESGFYPVAGFVMIVASIVALGAFLRKGESTLTPEAKIQFEADRRLRNAHQPEWWEAMEAFFRKRLVRYPLAAMLIWYAYTVSENPGAKMSEVVVLTLIALVAAYEVALWVVGIALVVGLGSLLFQGIAAIPVSVAVIIGALIIASAVREK